MQKILIATRNAGKFRGLKDSLGDLPFHFVSLADEKVEGDPVEDGETYEQNAIAKAEFFGQKTDLEAIADDSGIVVEALRGELGVKTRRWGAGHEATDEEWLNFFLKRMEAEKNRQAIFVCVVALYEPNQKTKVFRAETKGVLLKKPQTKIEPGIPLSSVFLPEGQTKVYSALSKEEFMVISHRGKAAKLCADYLRKKKPNL
jgi:XTP/dITP diphosphohydrolase